ncbi:reverse transcriptase domain-containing protein [Tanacetum coccineum]
MSDMTVCLNDLSYVPLNNEQNEPTQRDIGETSNELTQAQRNDFEELYANSNEELYPGCDFMTQLDFMANFTHLKVKVLQHVAGHISNIQSAFVFMYEKDYFYLTLLIPGLKSLRKDIDVNLRPLIDDLKDLWALACVETIDAATCKTLNMRAMLLWTINDFP